MIASLLSLIAKRVEPDAYMQKLTHFMELRWGNLGTYNFLIVGW